MAKRKAKNVHLVEPTWGQSDDGGPPLTEFRTDQVPETFLSQDSDALVQQLAAHDTACSYILITRSQEAATELMWGYSSRDWQQTVRAVEASGRFQAVYRSRDATILTLEHALPQCTAGW